MSLFAIADLHLSLNGEKPMDVFKGWHNYVERLEKNWRRVVQEGDTVVYIPTTSSDSDMGMMGGMPGGMGGGMPSMPSGGGMPSGMGGGPGGF